MAKLIIMTHGTKMEVEWKFLLVPFSICLRSKEYSIKNELSLSHFIRSKSQRLMTNTFSPVAVGRFSMRVLLFFELSRTAAFR